MHVSACTEGHIAAASLLINNGADIDALDNDWWTPLHSASASGAWRIVNILISSGALVNLPNSDGDFAIDVVGDSKVRLCDVPACRITRLRLHVRT